MTIVTRRWGTEMNRDTLGNAARAGFVITGIRSVFLDIVLSVRGFKPLRAAAGNGIARSVESVAS